MLSKKRKDSFDDSSIKVPFFTPYISKEDKKVVNNALDSVLLTVGPMLSKFESHFCKFTGSKHAIGVSSATAALHMSLKSAGVGSGDEVIVPDITFVATANAVLMTGATPVLVDVDKHDFTISIDSIRKSISRKTKSIIPVHFAGKSCQMDQIMSIAKKNNLSVIEDCAHAIGTKFKKKHVGTMGDFGCFSFYPTKNITTLEGGMIITNSKKYAEYNKLIRNHGITKTLRDRYVKGIPWEYDVVEPGYNYRLDEIRSSLGISQLKRIKSINSKRRKAFQYYVKHLSGIDGIITPITHELENQSCHLFIIKIKKDEFGYDRNYVFKKLLARGIRTSVHYKPLHLLSLSKKTKIYDELKNYKILFEQMLSLPFFTNISKKEQELVVKELKRIQKGNSKFRRFS